MMCVICAELWEDRLTVYEARRALFEISKTLDPDHLQELHQILNDLGVESWYGSLK